MFVEYSWLIPFVPLLAGLAIIFGLRVNQALSSVVSIAAVAFGCIYSFALLWMGASSRVDYSWLKVGNIDFSFGIVLDPLSLIMLAVICSVSLLVQIYSVGYMAGDHGYSKFFAFLSLFTASMLALVLSTNLFQMYIFWELVGLCSYLLIGFWHTKNAAGSASLKAFVMNRVGDCGFLIGILLVAYIGLYTGLYNDSSIFLGFDTLARFVDQLPVPQEFMMIVVVLLFMGAMAKSAQFPLHSWLPDAMEGPTPISALIHAATMVAAGVFLLARIFPIIGDNFVAASFIAVVGAFTALYAACIALTQNDIKKALAYSTCSQLGLMVMSVGCGAWIAAMFHLITHAFFKALLFLGAGSVIHGCHHEQDMQKFGGLRKYMPITNITFLLGTLSISAIPLLSGFWSKEQLLHAAWSWGEGTPQFVFIISVIASALTCFYMFRIYFMTFTGQYRGDAAPHESPKSILIPLVVLAIPTVLLGYIGTDLEALGGNHFVQFLGGESHSMGFIQFMKHSIFQPYAIIPICCTFAFISLAYFVYCRGRFTSCIDKLKGTFLYDWSVNKFYIDEAYNLVFVNGMRTVSQFFYTVIDRYLIGAGLELYCASKLMKLDIFKRLLHHGQIQGYILFTILSLFILMICVIQFVVGAEQSMQSFIEKVSLALSK